MVRLLVFSPLTRLMRAVRSGELSDDDIEGAKLFHQEKCAVHELRACNCVPQIFVATPEGRREILIDGTTRPIIMELH